MAHAQKPDFVFRRNGRVHLNRRCRHFSRLLAAEVCASAVVMLDTPCSEVEWRVLATLSIRQFPLHFPSRPSPCAITFQLESTAFILYVNHSKLLKMNVLGFSETSLSLHQFQVADRINCVQFLNFLAPCNLHLPPMSDTLRSYGFGLFMYVICFAD